MLRIGFTGTRNGMNAQQKQDVIKYITEQMKDNKIVALHGDCIGADKDFHDICHELNISIIIHPPKDDKLRAFCKSDNIVKPCDYLKRNKNIVDNSDILIACPIDNKPQLRSGTWATIRYGKKTNKKVLIFV